jgi:hypothetical protein
MSITALLMLAIPASVQTPQSDQAALAEQIIAAQIARETATERLATRGTVRTSTFHGRAFAPPLETTVEIALAEGRLLAMVNGIDLDAAGVRGADKPSIAQLERLYLPTGMVEVHDAKSNSVNYTEFHYKDARSVYSLLTPSELLWSFSSCLRSRTFAQRRLILEDVRGKAPEREVVCSASTEDGLQTFRYHVVEAWDWLPRRIESWARNGADSALTYAVDVTAAHHTRLGAIPAKGRITDTRNGATYHDVALEFEAPVFVGVRTPTTLNTTERFGDEAVNADPLYGPESFVAQNRLWDRGKLIEDLFRASRAGSDGVSPGAHDWLAWRAPWLLAAAALAAAMAVALRRSTRVAMVLAGGSLLLSAAPVINRWRTVQSPAEPQMIAAADDSLQSRSLCGVDTLYGLARCSGVPSPSYLRLLRLVRPGHHGTDLATLQRVAESTGLIAEFVEAGDYESPPVPAIVHVSGQHFVLLTGMRGDEVEVFDPGVGIVTQSWHRLRAQMSQPMLTSSKWSGS